MVGKSAFTFEIKTMGCKANIYDSLVLERELRELGGVPSRAKGESPDMFVLNSCTVTSEADRQSLREVGLVRKRAPGAWVVMTGCYAQLNARPGGVDCHVPNDAKGGLKRAVAEHFGLDAGAGLTDPDLYWGELPVEIGKTRAFIKIQEGCDDRCTYCIIPYARGASRSVPPERIIDEVARLTLLGINEIVITGTNIAEYGRDLPGGVRFEGLIAALLDRTAIRRVRLSSLDPSEISEELLGLFEAGSGRLLPHFHVSLQSPVSRVLRAMRRNYRSEDVVSALERIAARVPEAFVGMDVIAGFPSETRAEHEEGMALLRRLPWTRLHVFPYSEREGTPATRIPEVVPVEERRRRAAELRLLSQDRHESFARRFVGRELGGVLFENCVESGEGWFAVGHAGNYLRVLAKAGSRAQAEALHQSVARVRVLGLQPKPARDWTLEAVVVPTVGGA